MEEKNEIITNQISDMSKIVKTIINIGKDLENETKDVSLIKEENLYYFFFVKNIYNEKGTKLKEKEKLVILMNIINQYLKERNDFIFFYFKKLNINLPKIILNGYITTEIKDSEHKKNLLLTIKEIIDLFFSKKLFYFVYNKLSKIFRKYDLEENKEILLDKFIKIFDIWNLLFDINQKHKLDSNYFCFIGNQVLTLVNSEDKCQIDNVGIYIEFFEGVNYLNENNIDFSLFNIHYTDFGMHSLMLEGILNEKEKKNIKNIAIRVDGGSISYFFNVVEKDFEDNGFVKLNKIMEFTRESNFSKIEILKNYIGKIKTIKIIVKFKENNVKKLMYQIIPSAYGKGYEIIPTEGNLGFIQLYFNDKPICNKINESLLYEDIRYYGGIECFIPLIKIIKYFISSFSQNKDKIEMLYNMLIEIIKNIIKLVLYSNYNFENLKKILSPFLAALAEINHVLPNDIKSNFYSHYAFSLLYILIINSSVPFSLKKSYMLITGICNNDKLNLKFEELILDFDIIKNISYRWYITILIIIIEFILLEFNDIKILPKKLIDQLINLSQKEELNKDTELTFHINFAIQIINHLCFEENQENNFFKNSKKIDDLPNYFQQNIINNKENLMLIFVMIKIYLNLINFNDFFSKLELENQDIKEINNKYKEEEKNTYKNKFKDFFDTFIILSYEKMDILEQLVPFEFEDYIWNREYLLELFPSLKNNVNFKLESELIINEFTDFHKDYHNLMKNIFIFNKFWSDKKLFFTDEKRKKYLKYKLINYYTKNYQRQFIFPDLDYKSSYPSFSNFNIDKNFYIEEENPDNYNFCIDCPELDSFNMKYEKKLLEKIRNKNMMNIFEVCFVKNTHHVKGKLIICTDNSSLMKKILFISYPITKAKKIPCCNVLSTNPNYNKKNEKLCYGAIFVCPEKYMNIKIVIDIKDIRMILKRIYFYRKSAVEIFTTNKSYYFNFADDSTKNTSKFSEKNCENFTNMFAFFISEFFPIIIRKEIIGHSCQFQEMLTSYKNNEKKYDISIGNKFISSLFEHWASNIKGIEYSTLDLLIYLNLLSNRSYNDLFQYPVFPLLFFYDKAKDNSFHLLERKLNLHIGFQAVSEKSKQRKNLIKKSYADTLKELEEDEENEDSQLPSYFKTHYSTHFYTSNFQIRIFPYTFLAIELQGTGFDDPNRLFFSIEETFFNISFQKSDLRELIPEFYYFPEIFWNLNKVNFNKRANGIQVDDLIMPKDLNKIDKEKNYDDSFEKSEYYSSFKFIEKMRNLLESKQTDIISWINIIFGPGQKYKNPKDEDLYFRNESYIDYTNIKAEDFKYYRKDKNFMTSVEFGMTPIQIVFEGDTTKTKSRNNFYDSKIKEEKEFFKKLCKNYIDKIKTEINSNETEDKNKINNEEIKYSNLVNIFNSTYLYKISNNIKLKERKIQNINDNIISIFSNPHIFINCIFKSDNLKIIGYKTGKVEVFTKKVDDYAYNKISEFFDHNDEIIHLNYNPRLNMMCTTSKDGFVNVYIFPNKLLTTLKNPNKDNYFNFAFLCSNPFPSIIAFDQKSLEIFSYSINGFKIKKVNLKILLGLKETEKDLYLCTNFNENGGCFKDRLICIESIKEKECVYKCYAIRVPFFEKEEKNIDIKCK